MSETEPHQKTLTVVFADVRGSTRLYERHGDMRGRELTGWSVGTFCRAMEELGGTVIKTMGDGAMVTCPSAEAALMASVSTQEAHAGREVSIGIGLHFGVVIEEGGDVFGDAVNVAARLCSLANAGEILTSEETVRCFPPMMRSIVRHIDTTEVKGRRERVGIHQVVWDTSVQAGVTVLVEGGEGARKAQRVLILTTPGWEHRFTQDSDPLTLGRTQGDLVVPDVHASRQHARIENFRGRFLITDLSSNGTYVNHEHGAATILRRDGGELGDRGWIGLGRPPTPDNDCRIRFVVEEG